MERKILLILLVLLGALLGAHQFGNWDSIESKETKSRISYGETQEVEIWHMSSGKKVKINEDGTYKKFDVDGNEIEQGKYVNGKLVPKASAATYRWGILVFMFFALLFVYIFLWFASRENPPFQAFMDKYWPKRFVPFVKLSPEKAASITEKLHCKCQAKKIHFQKEEYDKNWDIRMAYFECLNCRQVFKVKRSKV